MPTTTTLREAVGLFHDATALRSAADQLMLNGFDRADLSILASEHAVRNKLHAVYGSATLEDDPQVPTVAYFSGDSLTELKAALIGIPLFFGAISASGALIANHASTASALMAAIVAGALSGCVGAVAAWWLTRHHDTYLDSQLRQGGLLLWVRTVDAAHEQRACNILVEAAAEHVHVHDIPRIVAGERSGPGKVVYGVLEFLAGTHRPA